MLKKVKTFLAFQPLFKVLKNITVDDVSQCDVGAKSVAPPLRAHTPQSIVTYGVAD